MENIKIIEKHFKRGMVVNDFTAFKKTHPTLLNCIINAMDELSEVVDDQNNLLQECKLQLEYLNEKFGETGTTNALLCRNGTQNETKI